MENGKLKLKLNRNFIKKNKYQVLIDDVLIGELDYKNLKLDFETTIGKHKIIIKDEDCEIEKHFYLSPQKIILPITISENFFWSKSNKFFLPIPVPAFMMKMIMGEMSSIILEGSRASNEKIKSTGFTFKYPNLNLALEDLINK